MNCYVLQLLLVEGIVSPGIGTSESDIGEEGNSRCSYCEIITHLTNGLSAELYDFVN